MGVADPDVTLAGPDARARAAGPGAGRRRALATVVFAGGLVAYTVHLLVVFWGAPAYCGGTGRTVAIVTTVLMAGAAAAATLLGARAVRQGAERQREREAGPPVPPVDALVAIPRPAWLLVAVGVLRSRPWRGEQQRWPRQAPAWDAAPSGGEQRWHDVAGTFLSGLALLILVLVGASLVVLPPCV